MIKKTATNISYSYVHYHKNYKKTHRHSRHHQSVTGSLSLLLSFSILLTLSAISELFVLYGLEACPLNASDIRSYINFVINRFFMKLFKTTDNEIGGSGREEMSGE